MKKLLTVFIFIFSLVSIASSEELIAIIKRGEAQIGETIDETKLIKEGSSK